MMEDEEVRSHPDCDGRCVHCDPAMPAKEIKENEVWRAERYLVGPPPPNEVRPYSLLAGGTSYRCLSKLMHQNQPHSFTLCVSHQPSLQSRSTYICWEMESEDDFSGDGRAEASHPIDAIVLVCFTAFVSTQNHYASSSGPRNSVHQPFPGEHSSRCSRD